MLDVIQIPVLSDNYVYLARDEASGATAVVDPAVHQPVMDKLDELGWTLTHILNTHHHPDHVGGNMALKDKYGCTVVGARCDAERIPGIDVQVGEGETYDLGESTAKVFEVPGHTSGHIAYWFAGDNALFCGDTLFALGCGRLFEGTPDQMWTSLSKFLDLPGDTRIFCAHEYTQANAAFALSVEPGNDALVRRSAEIDRMRADGIPTVPSTIGVELATNPFLRPGSANLQETIGMTGQDLVAVFAETRRRKDNF